MKADRQPGRKEVRQPIRWTHRQTVCEEGQQAG